MYCFCWVLFDKPVFYCRSVVGVSSLVFKSVGILTFKSHVRISLQAICKQPWASC